MDFCRLCNSNIFKYCLFLPDLRKQVYNQTLMGLIEMMDINLFSSEVICYTHSRYYYLQPRLIFLGKC